MKLKTKIVLEMILVLAITILLIYFLHGKTTLLRIIKIVSLTLLVFLSGKLRNVEKTNRK